uniref:Uncharacterized protein n=1 Tax=Ciona intestinalis TaxID=7719 RepID=H2XLW4_CIOIN
MVVLLLEETVDLALVLVLLSIFHCLDQLVLLSAAISVVTVVLLLVVTAVLLLEKTVDLVLVLAPLSIFHCLDQLVLLSAAISVVTVVLLLVLLLEFLLVLLLVETVKSQDTGHGTTKDCKPHLWIK